MTDSLTTHLRGLATTIAEMESAELAIRLTLLYLLLKPLDVWFLHVPMIVLVGAGLLSSRFATWRLSSSSCFLLIRSVSAICCSVVSSRDCREVILWVM